MYIGILVLFQIRKHHSICLSMLKKNQILSFNLLISCVLTKLGPYLIILHRK